MASYRPTVAAKWKTITLGRPCSRCDPGCVSVCVCVCVCVIVAQHEDFVAPPAGGRRWRPAAATN